MGTKCELSTNVMTFSLTYAIHWDARQSSIDSNFSIPIFIYTTAIAVMVLMSLINNIVCLQTFCIQEIRLTNCGIFQILFCFIGLLTLLTMQLRVLTMLVFDLLTDDYVYRYIGCSILPMLMIIMGDVCMWLNTLLVIEFVLLECFNFNLYRSRRFSIVSSIITIVLVSGSHLHEMIARRPTSDPDDPHVYICTFIYPLPVDIIDKVLRACHVILPCSIDFIGSICILISITHRILMVRGRKDLFRVFINQCIKRKYFFVPPLSIILTSLPHLILHLKDECEDARDTFILRLHIAFIILAYLPLCTTFFIYIYPSKSYMHRFKKTFIGYWLKRLFLKQEIMKPRAVSINTVTSDVPYAPPMTSNIILC
jgi:hypothetical protein